jgi:hypothetical protein
VHLICFVKHKSFNTTTTCDYDNFVYNTTIRKIELCMLIYTPPMLLTLCAKTEMNDLGCGWLHAPLDVCVDDYE